MSPPAQRLQGLLHTLSPPPNQTPELIGTLSLGALAIPIHATTDPERLPHQLHPLDITDPTVASHLLWIAQKCVLGQDIFLYGPPGPFARRLALTYCSLVNRPFELVSLHRDVGESDLKQGRELRAGGRLEYVDSPAVRAAKSGAILVLDGIERCERGVLPILNNLLENREINLEDGTHIVSADRYELMITNHEDTTNFIPAHRDFRVVALGTPVPPYPGFPLDPPFRSRFQVRYLDPLASSNILAQEARAEAGAHEIVSKTSDAISAIQISKEMRAKMSSGITSSDDVPAFPQTSLLKLSKFLSLFPPPHSSLSSPSDFAAVLLAFHPALSYITPPLWRSLEAALTDAGLGDYSTGLSSCDPSSPSLSTGLWSWSLSSITRTSLHTAIITFSRAGVDRISLPVACGPRPFLPYPLKPSPELLLTPRFFHTLTTLFQLHAMGDWDIAISPPSASLQSASSSTTLVIETFAQLLGYELETVHLVKDLGGGRELFMRRVVETGLGEGESKGATGWEPAPMTKGAWEGKLVHLEGIDAIGATVGSLGRLLNDREAELWEGRRLVGRLNDGEENSKILSLAHPSFRIIATPTKSSPPREWLTEELASIFVSLPTISMPLEEEKALLLSTNCPPPLVDTIETFARAYRRANGAPGSKSRRLGTASLLRMARRLAQFPGESLYEMVNRTLLSAFLPPTTRSELGALLEESGIVPGPVWYNPPPQVTATSLVFPAASDPQKRCTDYVVPLFDMSIDPTGSSHVPFMNNYLDNTAQTALIRDIATDLEILGEHILLLGNQGVGKNKIIDRLLQLLKRPREFIQLHRDSTPQYLMFQTSLDGGVLRYVDSPLLRAVKYGRVLVIDETDKAAAHVVAGLASLAKRGEMTLPDGRKIRPAGSFGDASDIVVHSEFRMILLANRPGFPFLGNPFLRVLGDNFSCYAVSNPDAESEQRVLSQLAPELDPDLLRSLVRAFGDLRLAFESGTLPYPFSLRELLALVRHMKRFPEDELEQVLRNVFDFDINRPETLDALYDILRKHKLAVERIGIDAARAGSGPTKKTVVIEFTPKGDTSLSEPKFGKSPDGKSHTGGNTWAGGTGGRDTAGLGGRGGYMRLATGQDISQIPDQLKEAVSDEIKDKAREMARKELAARLAEIDLTSGESNTYSGYHNAVLPHIHQLVSFLDNLEANEEERVWLKRQSDGELDESKLTEGLTGESAIYKRRGMEKPELGAPQLKPKRIRFIFDLSASMYRNSYDGRLTRSLEAAVMILESFARLSRKEKYRIDLVGQSGEEAVIPLVALDALPTHAGDRFKVIQKMAVVPQYAWAGDHTIEAIKQGVSDVAESDSDDFFVIAITDANFSRYGITAEDLKLAMDSNPKVKCSLLAIGEGAEAAWLPKSLPGRAYRVVNTTDIATNLRAILGQLLSGGV